MSSYRVVKFTAEIQRSRLGYNVTFKDTSLGEKNSRIVCADAYQVVKDNGLWPGDLVSGRAILSEESGVFSACVVNITGFSPMAVGYLETERLLNSLDLA